MTTSSSAPAKHINYGHAVTRSLLGWGVVAGPFYLILGLAQALLVPGFDLGKHALSLLLLGPLGWIQTVNLVLSALMVTAAAIGFIRLLPSRRNAAAGIFLILYALSLVAAAVFRPDPMRGFPLGGTDTTVPSTSGLLHILAGAIGFVSLAVAALVVGLWLRKLGKRIPAVLSFVAAVIIVIGFAGGAALSMGPAGVGILWLTVVVGWGWLAYASVVAYRIAPSPVL